MTAQLPDPLVSAEVDISKLDGFMLDTRRLLSSELMALSTGDEFKAAVQLWCRAWQQQPAASLPNNPRVLASFAGVSLQRWGKIKEMALRGFVLCGDGRLYHKVLAEQVNDAWRRPRRYRYLLERCRRGGLRRRPSVGGPGLRSAVWGKTDGLCTYCGCQLTTHDVSAPTHFHVDHARPLALGGSNHPDNLVPACRRCNLAKGAKPSFQVIHGGAR